MAQGGAAPSPRSPPAAAAGEAEVAGALQQELLGRLVAHVEAAQAEGRSPAPRELQQLLQLTTSLGGGKGLLSGLEDDDTDDEADARDRAERAGQASGAPPRGAGGGHHAQDGTHRIVGLGSSGPGSPPGAAMDDAAVLPPPPQQQQQQSGRNAVAVGRYRMSDASDGGTIVFHGNPDESPSREGSPPHDGLSQVALAAASFRAAANPGRVPPAAANPHRAAPAPAEADRSGAEASGSAARSRWQTGAATAGFSSASVTRGERVEERLFRDWILRKARHFAEAEQHRIETDATVNRPSAVRLPVEHLLRSGSAMHDRAMDRLERLQRQREEEEMQKETVAAKVHITPVSGTLMSNAAPFIARQRQYADQKRAWEEEQARLKEQKEMLEQEAGRRPLKLTAKARTMQRGVDELLAWEKQKRETHKMMKKRVEDDESRELTFKPKLSERSLRLASRARYVSAARLRPSSASAVSAASTPRAPDPASPASTPDGGHGRSPSGGSSGTTSFSRTTPPSTSSSERPTSKLFAAAVAAETSSHKPKITRKAANLKQEGTVGERLYKRAGHKRPPPPKPGPEIGWDQLYGDDSGATPPADGAPSTGGTPQSALLSQAVDRYTPARAQGE